MSSGVRRAHRKSRHGCGQCKKRRIKCDERPPRCGNCSKRHVECDYELLGYPPAKPAATEPQRKKQAVLDGNSRGNNGSLIVSTSLSDMTLNLRHLELMHHYVTKTSLTLNNVDKDGGIWQEGVPNMAISHDFLMHSILAISALHIVHLRGLDEDGRRYLGAARAHHDKALSCFHSGIKEITRSNYTAAVAFSALLLIFSCGLAQISHALHHRDNVDCLITVLAAFRSHFRLFNPVQPCIDGKLIGGFHACGGDVHVDLCKESTVEEPFRMLKLTNKASADNEEDKAIYHKAILSLQESAQSVSVYPRLLWPVAVSPEFIGLLQKKRPMALVVLAYGCVLSKYAPYRWFMHNWAANVTNSIAKLIDPEWAPALRWPLDEFGLV